MRQRLHLDRTNQDDQRSTVTAGACRGGVMRFQIAAADDGATVVTASLRSTRRGPRVLAPVLRPILGRALAQALAEDKADLEQGNYTSDKKRRTA